MQQRFVHAGLILPKMVKKELTEGIVMPDLVSSLRKYLPSISESTTSLLALSGWSRDRKEVTRPWRSGLSVGQAETQDKLSQGLPVFSEIVHMDYRPEVIP